MKLGSAFITPTRIETMRRIIQAIVTVILWGFFLAIPAGAGGTFSGTVVSVSPLTGSMTVRGPQTTVTFDLTNPVLKGYRNLGSIRKGDRIAVSYTASGIRITKGHGSAAPAIAAKTGPDKERPRRDKVSHGGTGFEDIDENKDNRISPVELSAAIADLSMSHFSRYDKNGDGFLDRSEFGSIHRGPSRPETTGPAKEAAIPR